MGKILIAENGRIRKLADVELAEDIVKTRNQKDHWAVIDKLIKTWEERTPDEVQAIKINLSQYKESLDDKEFGQTRLGKEQERRFSLVFPLQLQNMIRTLYSADDVPFSKEFYREFSKRYPRFRVAEKI